MFMCDSGGEMLKEGQKLGVYLIKSVFVTSEDFGCYLSEDPSFKSKVLLNVYPIDYLSKDQQSCLKQKLDQLFLLDHPGIVPAIDIGYEKGCFYFTTQYYAENSFEQRVIDGISVAEIKNLFQNLAQTLEYAESCDHIHGKIETEEIVFDEKGEVKLLNFGVRQCLDIVQTESVTPKATISESLVSLGQHIQKFLSQRHKNIDDSLNVIIDRCLSRGEHQYQSFKTLAEDLDRLVIGGGEADMSVKEGPGNAMQKVGIASISEEQRIQILPHVRELISEKNRVQADFDAFKLSYEKIQQDLDNALQETENLTQRLHLVTKFDREQERKKLIASIFSGVVFCLLLTTSFSYFMNLLDRPEAVEKSVVYEMKPQPVLKEVVIAPVGRPESQKKLQSMSDVSVGIEAVEATKKAFSAELVNQPAWSVVDSGRNLFNVSTAQAAHDDEIIFDKVESNAIEQTLIDWSEFWARQEVDRYFSYYSDSFQPAKGMDIGKWKKIRKARLKYPDWIEVGVSEVNIHPLSSQRARVLFQQHYRSDRF